MARTYRVYMSDGSNIDVTRDDFSRGDAETALLKQYADSVSVECLNGYIGVPMSSCWPYC